MNGGHDPPSAATDAEDLGHMRLALALAARAEALGEVPVGAVVVRCGEVVGVGHNRNIALRDPSAHAEIEALRAAGQRLGNHRLVDCTLYCTLEPCAMCVGALVHARIARLVYAAADPKTGACGSVFDLVQSPHHNHRIVVAAGLLAEEAGALLRRFFRARRSAVSSAMPGASPCPPPVID